MSSDRFISGVQLPNVDVGVTVRASDGAAYRRTYYKQGNLYITDEAGTETQLTGLSITFSDLDTNSVIVSAEAFADVDDQLMSAAAINDLIDSRISGLGGLSNVVEDTTPQLGGDLDLNSNSITGTGNISYTGDLSVVGDANITSSINMISPDTTNTITIDMTDSDSLTFTGDSGELFSVSDSLTGTIFSVADISGIPLVEVDADTTIRFAQVNGTVLVGTTTDNGVDKVQVNGSLSASSININAESIADTDIINWNDAYSWGDHSTAGYLTSETVTSLSLATNILSYTDENGTTTDLDLSLYLDDTNLARLVSGSLDGATGIATFTRDDATTFTVDFSPFFDDTNLARITSASFDTADGVLTLTRDDATTVTVDLDGRYLENVVEDTTPQLGGNLDINGNDITGTGNINITGTATIASSIDLVSPDTTNTISIDMLDSDAISFSGDSGELFSVTDSLTGTIFAVNDISGVPSIEVDSDGTVRFVEIDGNVLVGTSVDDGVHKLQVDGSIIATELQLSGGTGDQGTLSWNTDEETLDLNEGIHTLRLGQEVLYHVRNNSGASIAIGTPVMATGTLGASGRITIAPMDGTNAANAKFYLGVATETIANDADGKVTHFGKVRGIDTSVWSEGDVLWISTDTVGAFTTTEPTIGMKIPTAFVLNSTNNGTIVVRAKNSVGLLDLDDVLKATLTQGDYLSWDATNSYFAPTPINPVSLRVNGTQVAQIEATGDSTDSQIVFRNYQDTILSTAFSVDQTGQLTATSFVGDGSQLTNVNYSVTAGDVTQHQAALSITESQISDLQNYLTTESNDLSVAVTWANVPDANITQSSVTQHEAALTITESQISDLQSYLTTESDTLDTVTGRGATTTNDISVGGLSASYVDFPNTGTIARQEGRVFYDAANKCLAVYNDEADVTLQIGQEEWVRVYNNSGATITNGAPVYLSGESAGIPTIALASAATETAAQCVGLATHDIENNAFGYITTRGIINDMDTSGLTQGQRVHVSPTAGVLQTDSPTYPYYATDVGICLISSATIGCIYVSISEHSAESFRTSGDASFDGNVRIGGNLTLLGSQSTVQVNNIRVDDNIIYLNGGDAIGPDNTTFTGTGLDDAYFTDYYEGNDAGTTYYVRIDGVGTGTGGVDTFEWSTDNFSTTEATGVDITGEPQALSNNIKILFAATTGHTSGDTWEGTAQPSNVDIGFMGNRNTGASGIGYSHVGFFFDTADTRFKTFSQYDLDPIGGNINAGDASFVFGDLEVKDLYVTNIFGTSFNGNSSTATGLQTARDIALDGAVTGSASFSGLSDITITATLNSNLADLNDVSGTAPTDGQVLTYNDTSGEWEPADSTGGGGSFLPTKVDPIAVVDGQATYALTVSGSAYTPASINTLMVSLNGVTQSPGDAFTISGSNITFIPALQTNDVIDYIIDIGAAVETLTTTETDTLDTVTNRGSSTTNAVTVGELSTGLFTSTGKIVEQTYTLTGTTPALDPANGTIQYWVLTGNSTPTDGLSNGEFLTLQIDDGASYTVTWPTMNWVGGSAPILFEFENNIIHLWKINNILYGSFIGAA